MDTESDRNEEAPLRPPEVIMCGGCRAVLGDTLVGCPGAEESNAFIVISSCPGAERGDDVTTASSGPEAGSTYDALLCKSCKARVGRVFLATSSAFDWMRDRYSLDPSATTRYQLGAGASATDLQRSWGRPSADTDSSDGAAGGAREHEGEGEGQQSAAPADAATADIDQLKRVAVAMSERIDCLEEKVRELRRGAGGKRKAGRATGRK